MIFDLLCLVAFLGVIGLLVFGFSKRYGKAVAFTAVFGSLGISLLISMIIFISATQNLEENADPAIPWRLLHKPEEGATTLEYRPSSGLYAINNSGETQIANKNAFCESNGRLSKLEPIKIEISSEIPDEVPPPPKPTIRQVSFLLHYPVEMDGIAFSSFAIFEDGEIWCTERYRQGGPSGFAGLAFVTGFYFFVSLGIFIVGFIALLIAVFICLEIYRWRRKGTST